MSLNHSKNASSMTNQLRGLKEIREDARNPNITNEEAIERLIMQLTELPASDFFHPSIKKQINYTPWWNALRELSLPDEAPELLNFGEMMVLSELHLEKCDHGFDLEHLTEAQDIEHNVINRTASAEALLKHLAQLANSY